MYATYEKPFSPVLLKAASEDEICRVKWVLVSSAATATYPASGSEFSAVKSVRAMHEEWLSQTFTVRPEIINSQGNDTVDDTYWSSRPDISIAASPPRSVALLCDPFQRIYGTRSACNNLSNLIVLEWEKQKTPKVWKASLRVATVSVNQSILGKTISCSKCTCTSACASRLTRAPTQYFSRIQWCRCNTHWWYPGGAQCSAAFSKLFAHRSRVTDLMDWFNFLIGVVRLLCFLTLLSYVAISKMMEFGRSLFLFYQKRRARNMQMHER